MSNNLNVKGGIEYRYRFLCALVKLHDQSPQVTSASQVELTSFQWLKAAIISEVTSRTSYAISKMNIVLGICDFN